MANPNSSSTSVTMDEDKKITANFKQVTQDREAGRCSYDSDESGIPGIELLAGWGVIALIRRGSYYLVSRSGKRRI